MCKITSWITTPHPLCKPTHARCQDTSAIFVELTRDDHNPFWRGWFTPEAFARICVCLRAVWIPQWTMGAEVLWTTILKPSATSVESRTMSKSCTAKRFQRTLLKRAPEGRAQTSSVQRFTTEGVIDIFRGRPGQPWQREFVPSRIEIFLGPPRRVLRRWLMGFLRFCSQMEHAPR